MDLKELAQSLAETEQDADLRANCIEVAIKALGDKDKDLGGDARAYMRRLQDHLLDDADVRKAFVEAASKRIGFIKAEREREERAAANAIEVAAFIAGEEEEPEPTPKAIHFADVSTDLPRPILSIEAEDSGAILSDGAILTLAGEGGIGKSALAAQMAYCVAVGQSIGGLITPKTKGPVIYATFEDIPGIVASQVAFHHELAINGGKKAKGKTKQPDITERDVPVHITDMNDAPLFGPVDRVSGDKGFYNQMPDRLPGWNVLWDAANDIKPHVIIIDSATDAYVGEANSVPQVAAFLAALRTTARQAPWECGIILLAHSNKQARRGNDKGPDPFQPGNVAGSTAWTDKARGVLAFMWGANKGERLLSVPKANYGVAKVMCDPEPMRKGKRIMGFKMPSDKGKGWRTDPATNMEPKTPAPDDDGDDDEDNPF